VHGRAAAFLEPQHEVHAVLPGDGLERPGGRAGHLDRAVAEVLAANDQLGRHHELRLVGAGRFDQARPQVHALGHVLGQPEAVGQTTQCDPLRRLPAWR